MRSKPELLNELNTLCIVMSASSIADSQKLICEMRELLNELDALYYEQ